MVALGTPPPAGAAAAAATASPPLSLLPFDAHNHIQLGPPPPSLGRCKNAGGDDDGDTSECGAGDERPLVRSLGEYIRHELRGKHLSGMALMATHPRDFSTLFDLELEAARREHASDGTTETEPVKILPCLGVHPWFLHELDPEDDWAMVVPSSSSSGAAATTGRSDDDDENTERIPRWIDALEGHLLEHPHVPVGEIGLDNFHFDPDTGELTTPMETQVRALVLQLRVATRHHRPVSLHCVRATGKIMDALEDVAAENHRRLSEEMSKKDDTGGDKPRDGYRVLPPRIYFHAFGGKAPTATQLIKTLEKPRRIKIPSNQRGKKKFVPTIPPRVYFGFAPPVNLASPKTASVVRAVGLDRLVLETDREDVLHVGPDMETGIEFISGVLGVGREELIATTNANVRDLYYN